MKRLLVRFLIVSALLATAAASANLFGNPSQSAAPPDPEIAFRVSVRVPDSAQAQLRFDIDDCCYLYREKTVIELVDAAGAPARGASLGNFTLPAGKAKHDEIFGNTEVYYGSVDIDIPVNKLVPGLALKVKYQGCSEKGVAICYAPITKILALTAAEQVDTAVSETGSPGLWLALLGAFGAGLLLTFTPCVLPMIPILSGVIVGTEGRKITKLRGGLLSYAYVLGTAVTYALAGALAGATGEHLSAYFQNVWAIGLFSAILVALALSLFGLYELQMPAFVQSLLHHHSARLHRRSRHLPVAEFVGVFVLGLASALIIGACVSPILISALGTAIATRDPWLGAGIMTMLAHGQGAILIAAGVGAGWLLPKAGPWMHTVKYVFGVMLIGVALYLLSFLVPATPAAHDSIFERVTSAAQLETRLADAQAADRPVLLDYYADWCNDCVRMEKTTFADPEVRAALAGFMLLQADVTRADDPESQALKRRFGVYGPPATLFFGADGVERAELRSYGYLDRAALEKNLDAMR